jgi:uncharacterized protein (TIGR03118 family)
MKHIYGWSLIVAAGALSLAFSTPGVGFYERTDLLSDGSLSTPNVNPNVVNAWGLASSPTGPFWTANEGTGTSSILHADGSAFAPDVLVPGDQSAHATGLVFNGNGGFEVHRSGLAGTSLFIFVTLDGRIIGWSPQVDPADAIVAVDNSGSGASYTGAAMATREGHPLLFVANFASGAIDVYDARFHSAGSFTDPTVPANYAPFGIANVGGRVFVTFVPRDPTTGDEQTGAGHGLIDVFESTGAQMSRLATGGELNAPWGMVTAPDGFGPFSNKLLVGNFGDGRILAFGHDGGFLGALTDNSGQPIVIEGLWGLLFGNGGNGGDPEDLYFTAGPGDEKQGLFGEIEFSR